MTRVDYVTYMRCQWPDTKEAQGAEQRPRSVTLSCLPQWLQLSQQAINHMTSANHWSQMMMLSV